MLEFVTGERGLDGLLDPFANKVTNYLALYKYAAKEDRLGGVFSVTPNRETAVLTP